jgi:hypothetical protein
MFQVALSIQAGLVMLSNVADMTGVLELPDWRPSKGLTTFSLPQSPFRERLEGDVL